MLLRSAETASTPIGINAGRTAAIKPVSEVNTCCMVAESVGNAAAMPSATDCMTVLPGCRRPGAAAPMDCTAPVNCSASCASRPDTPPLFSASVRPASDPVTLCITGMTACRAGVPAAAMNCRHASFKLPCTFSQPSASREACPIAPDSFCASTTI